MLTAADRHRFGAAAAVSESASAAGCCLHAAPHPRCCCRHHCCHPGSAACCLPPACAPFCGAICPFYAAFYSCRRRRPRHPAHLGQCRPRAAPGVGWWVVVWCGRREGWGKCVAAITALHRGAPPSCRLSCEPQAHHNPRRPTCCAAASRAASSSLRRLLASALSTDCRSFSLRPASSASAPACVCVRSGFLWRRVLVGVLAS